MSEGKFVKAAQYHLHKGKRVYISAKHTSVIHVVDHVPRSASLSGGLLNPFFIKETATLPIRNVKTGNLFWMPLKKLYIFTHSTPFLHDSADIPF